MADLGQILRWASHSAASEHTLDDRTFWVQQLPPEERLESLAARLRPLILDDDPIHHRKVFGAIGFLLGDEDRATKTPTIRQLRKGGGARFVPTTATSAPTAPKSSMGTRARRRSPSHQNRLAFSWIY